MDTHREARRPPSATAGPALISANDDQFIWSPPPLRLLLLDDGASRVRRAGERNKRDEIWHGMGYGVSDGDGEPQVEEFPIYVRLGARHSLVAEVVCGRLAKTIGLPAPEVFIVVIPPGHLPKSRHIEKGQTHVCIGTHDLGGGNFSQFLNDSEDEALSLLRDWPELGRVAAFDEWVANPDRNLSNLIYARQTLHIIDHAEALGGGAKGKYRWPELVDIAFDNILAGLIHASFSEAKVAALLQEMADWLSSCSKVFNAAAVIPNFTHEKLLAEDERQELIDFITQRLLITHALLCQRMGHPQLQLSTQA